MKFATYILPLLAAATARVAYASTLSITAPPRPDSDTYVWVRYSDNSQHFFKFNECYPYQIGNAIAQEAVWYASTICVQYEGPNCTGDTFPPLGVPVPGGTVLANVADFVQIIGQGALCSANPGLPNLPIVENLGL
ncbi:hypothetical protein K439DRAFT_1627897 [Ramaria rubella]|nr:hypothetical protein K439DRAFT_1627897 [Ramaria rubella]